MVQFNDWCSAEDSNVGSHTLRVLSGDPANLNLAIAAIAVVVPTHYAAEEQLSRVLARFGKPAAAAFVQGKLRTSKSIRSGELGEILATEYIAGKTAFHVPIKPEMTRRQLRQERRHCLICSRSVLHIHASPEQA